MATKQSFKNGVEYANESFGHRCDENKYDYDQLKEAFDAGQGSLRDHFAGLAMQGMLVGTLGRLSEGGEVSAYAHGPHNGAVAERAYAVADAMIAERSK